MRRPLVPLAALASVFVIGLFGCGGNDDGGGAGTNGETAENGDVAGNYVDGACVKPGAAGSAFPSVVDCDDPAATGVLRETDDYQKCEGEGLNLLTVGGEEVNKQFCVDPKP